MTMELVAISVAREVERIAGCGRRPSIATAFVGFLEKFLNFDGNVAIFFPFTVNPNLQTLHAKYLAQTAERPVILDPVDPYDNLARNLQPEAKAAFKTHAKNTLEAIRNYRPTNSASVFKLESYF